MTLLRVWSGVPLWCTSSRLSLSLQDCKGSARPEDDKVELVDRLPLGPPVSVLVGLLEKDLKTGYFCYSPISVTTTTFIKSKLQ